MWKTKILETGLGEEQLSLLLTDTLTELGLSLSDTYMLPFGDHHSYGLILVYQEP